MSAGGVTSIRCITRCSGLDAEGRLLIAGVGDPRGGRVAVVGHPRRNGGVLGQPGGSRSPAPPAAGATAPGCRAGCARPRARRPSRPRSAAPRTSGRCPWTPRSGAAGRGPVRTQQGGHAGPRLGYGAEDVVGPVGQRRGRHHQRAARVHALYLDLGQTDRGVRVDDRRHLDPQPIGAYAVEVDDRLPRGLVGLDAHLLTVGDDAPLLDRLQAERRPGPPADLAERALGAEVDLDPLVRPASRTAPAARTSAGRRRGRTTAPAPAAPVR